MNRRIERTTAFSGFNTDSRHPVTVKNVVQGVESLELFKLAEVALLIKFHRSNPMQIAESLGASSVLSPHRKRDIPEWIFWRSLRCKYISRITGRLFALISSSLEGSHKQYMESGVHWIQQRGNWILFHWSQSRAAAVPLSRPHFRSLGVWNILLSLLVLIPPFATIQLDGGIAGWIITLPFYYSPPMTFVVPFFLSIVGAFINKSAKEAARGGGGKNGESISRWTALVHCVVFVSAGK